MRVELLLTHLKQKLTLIAHQKNAIRQNISFVAHHNIKHQKNQKTETLKAYKPYFARLLYKICILAQKVHDSTYQSNF
jgi:hypothetical protein